MKASLQPTTPDPRHLSHGREIPTESSSDQPYIVRTDDGAWLCCVTTGPGHEGARGQHVVTLRSTDRPYLLRAMAHTMVVGQAAGAAAAVEVKAGLYMTT